MADVAVREAMDGAFGCKDASDEKLARLAKAIDACGAKDASIARARDLSGKARAALPALELSSEVTAILAGAITALTERAS
jgi:hypothetical protein